MYLIDTDSTRPRTKIHNLSIGIVAAGLSSLLLYLSHSTWGSGLWALMALVPILVVSSRTRSLFHITLFGFIASVGPSTLMFESIAAAYPWAAAVAMASQAPQFILPLIVWSRLSTIRATPLAVIAFSTIWVLWEQFRLHPLLAGEFASFYSLAYSQVDTGLLTQTYGGIGVISALIAACNAVLAVNFINRRLLWSFPLLLLFLPAVGHTDQYSEVPSDNDTTIRIIQPAWTPSEQVLMHGTKEHSMQYMQQLIVIMLEADNDVSYSFLPETSLHHFESAERMGVQLQGRLQKVIAGAALFDGPSPSNAVLMIGENQIENLYKKWQLVPVYETPVFTAGNYLAIVQLGSNFNLGILVCMDGTSAWLMDQSKQAGADAIVVLSASDYGRGYSTPELHLHMIRAQAMLHGLPVVFLASNGPSAFVTPNGAISQQLAEGIQGALTIQLTPWEKTSSQASWYRHTSNPVLALTLAVGGLLGFRCRRS